MEDKLSDGLARPPSRGKKRAQVTNSGIYWWLWNFNSNSHLLEPFDAMTVILLIGKGERGGGDPDARAQIFHHRRGEWGEGRGRGL